MSYGFYPSTCPICDEQFLATALDLPAGFCESCADAINADVDALATILAEIFNAQPVEVLFHSTNA